jgi:hypothetical protein
MATCWSTVVKALFTLPVRFSMTEMAMMETNAKISEYSANVWPFLFPRGRKRGLPGDRWGSVM